SESGWRRLPTEHEHEGSSNGEAWPVAPSHSVMDACRTKLADLLPPARLPATRMEPIRSRHEPHQAVHDPESVQHDENAGNHESDPDDERHRRERCQTVLSTDIAWASVRECQLSPERVVSGQDEEQSGCSGGGRRHADAQSSDG